MQLMPWTYDIHGAQCTNFPVTQGQREFVATVL